MGLMTRLANKAWWFGPAIRCNFQPTALVRKRAMGFMEGTIAKPSNLVNEADS
jgi:hypothetical protein